MLADDVVFDLDAVYYLIGVSKIDATSTISTCIAIHYSYTFKLSVVYPTEKL